MACDQDWDRLEIIVELYVCDSKTGFFYLYVAQWMFRELKWLITYPCQGAVLRMLRKKQGILELKDEKKQKKLNKVVFFTTEFSQNKFFFKNIVFLS